MGPCKTESPVRPSIFLYSAQSRDEVPSFKSPVPARLSPLHCCRLSPPPPKEKNNNKKPARLFVLCTSPSTLPHPLSRQRFQPMTNLPTREQAQGGGAWQAYETSVELPNKSPSRWQNKCLDTNKKERQHVIFIENKNSIIIFQIRREGPAPALAQLLWRRQTAFYSRTCQCSLRYTMPVGIVWKLMVLPVGLLVMSHMVVTPALNSRDSVTIFFQRRFLIAFHM